MGYSCATAAYVKLERYFAGGRGNTWTYKGQTYFYQRGREQADGAIVGSVNRCLPDSMARRVGSFRIEPSGAVTRAPFGMLASAPVAPPYWPRI